MNDPVNFIDPDGLEYAPAVNFAWNSFVSNIPISSDISRIPDVVGPGAGITANPCGGSVSTGFDIPNYDASKTPTISDIKKALRKIYEIMGKLPKWKPGKWGSPQRGDSNKGYRFDPPHNTDPNSKESSYHINYWNYSNGKRGSGGVKDAIPVG